jgi:hypothetical protein
MVSETVVIGCCFANSRETHLPVMAERKRFITHRLSIESTMTAITRIKRMSTSVSVIANPPSARA